MTLEQKITLNALIIGRPGDAANRLPSDTSVFFPDSRGKYTKATAALGDDPSGGLFASWVVAQYDMWVRRTYRKRQAKKILLRRGGRPSGPLYAQYCMLIRHATAMAFAAYTRWQLRQEGFARNILPPISPDGMAADVVQSAIELKKCCVDSLDDATVREVLTGKVADENNDLH